MKVLIKGAGDLASGIACRLHHSGMDVVMTEIGVPTTVRRTVALSPAIYEKQAEVEGIEGVRCDSLEKLILAVAQRKIPVLEDPQCQLAMEWKPDVVVDAIIAKKNLGTSITDAKIVIGVGPGFTAGVDCHCVVETKRGHDLGRVLWKGSAVPNTGVPGMIGGYAKERIIRASGDGIFKGMCQIGDLVEKGQLVGMAGENPIYAEIPGVVRGLLQDGVPVKAGMKSGDIDPRAVVESCYTVSDKARAIGGGVLEAILTLQTRNGRQDLPVVLVMLAAGNSERFGENKLLYPVDGKPMYEHLADQIEELNEDIFQKKIVVTQYPQIAEKMENRGFEVCLNEHPELGISYSVRLAAEKAWNWKRDAAVCFAVSDQPYLKGETLKGLMDQWRASGKGIGALAFQGEIGNPVVFAQQYQKELMELTGDKGGKRIVKRHMDDLFLMEVKDPQELRDLDTKREIG